MRAFLKGIYVFKRIRVLLSIFNVHMLYLLSIYCIYNTLHLYTTSLKNNLIGEIPEN